MCTVTWATFSNAVHSSYIQSLYTNKQFTLNSGLPHDADSICLVATYVCTYLRTQDT